MTQTQTFTSEMQDSMVLAARVNASEGKAALYSSVSSADMWWETEWWLITTERGEVYTMKRAGPRTEPGGGRQSSAVALQTTINRQADLGSATIT